MPSLPRVLRRPRLTDALTAAAVMAAVLVSVPTVALADGPADRTVVGELVQAWPEDQHGADRHASGEAPEAPLSWVETAEGEAVRVPTEDVAGVVPGSTVEVTVGGQVDDAAAADGYAPAVEVLETDVSELPAEDEVPDAGPTNEVTVVMVAPRGSTPDGTNLQTVVDLVDGPVADFWAEQTDGAISLAVTAPHDWLATRAGCKRPAQLWNEVAAEVGFVDGPGRHLVVYLPEGLETCDYALGEVGTAPASGGRVFVRAALASVIAHELGHNFGLGHSSGLHCEQGTDRGAGAGGDCRTDTYRDYYDVMGASWEELGSLNAAQASALGTLPDDAVRTLTPAAVQATVALAPLSGRAGTRAVRLADGRGGELWLELRTPRGRDAWLGEAGNRFGLEAGVLVRRAGTWPDTSLLLDGSPGGGEDDLQATLPVGEPVALAGGFTVTVTEAGISGATLLVRNVPATATAGTASAEPPTAARPEALPVQSCTDCATVSTDEGPTVADESLPAAGVAAASPVAGSPVAGSPVAADVEPAEQQVATASARLAATPVAVPIAGALLVGSGYLLLRRLRDRRIR